MSTVRFAPSPTGTDIHPGNLRIALINYILYIQHGGKFILRIEDTANDRVIEGADKTIINSLKMPFTDVVYQSNNKSSHLATAKKLMYRNMAYEHDGAIWFKGYMVAKEFTDKVYGKVTADEDTLKDFVIVRQNGEPSFILANIVDDLEEGVTDVVRGCDHLKNTLKQIGIANALGYEAPSYCHLSLITSVDGKPLSKRDEEGKKQKLLEKGILWRTLMLYIGCLGMKQFESWEELVENFSFSLLKRSPVVFNMKHLEALNRKLISYEDIKESNIPLHVWKAVKHHIKYTADINNFRYLWERPELVSADKEILKLYMSDSDMCMEKYGKKEMFNAVRMAVCGSPYSLDLDLVKELIGEKEFFERISRGI